MKFVVIGANGRTGINLVQQALDGGHHVTALVRDPQKITITNENLTVRKTDLLSQDDMNEALKDHDTVISCLGNSGARPWTHSTLYEDTVKTMVESMRKNSIKRLVCMTTAMLRSVPGNWWVWEWFMRPLLSRGVLNSMVVMEDYLTNDCQDIDFTVVKPPGLTEKPLEDGEIVTEESELVKGGAQMIPRANVAKFMLDIVNNEEFHRKKIAIALKVDLPK